jgi:hypothetical protein
LTPLPLPERVTFTTNAGDDDLIEITGNFRADIRTALAFEHGDCEDAGCDIAVARIEGFPLTAAYLLTGATETPVLDAVQGAYAAAEAIPEEDALTDFPASERTAWFAWHEANARMCPSCSSITYALQEIEPEQCANCRASLMHDYVFAVILHVRTNRKADEAYDALARGDIEGEPLFQSNAYVVTREQAASPDFGVEITYGEDTLAPEQS